MKHAIVWHKYPEDGLNSLMEILVHSRDSDGNAPHVLPYNDIVVRNPGNGVFSTQRAQLGLLARKGANHNK